MLQCYNRGCGQTFDPAKNTEESCRHHPGEPYFHDAYKTWSCCNKRSADFTEFLNIKGCTLSKHSNEKPPEPEKPTKGNTDEVIEVRAPIQQSMKRPSIDSPMTTIKASVEDSVKKLIDGMLTTSKAETSKAAEGIPIGTSCKNSGCKCSYKGAAAEHEECLYHPGVPIFHEGMKYWSCCEKKTTDFAEFMAQTGCASGDHKWIEKDCDTKLIECRHDWHQTATDVVVSVYAKKYHYGQSIIKVNPIRLQVLLIFPEHNNAYYNFDLELRGVVDVKQTSAHMFSTKVEITMRKAEPGTWPNLKLLTNKQTSPVPEPVRKKQPTNNSYKFDDDRFRFDLDDIVTLKPGDVLITGRNKSESDSDSDSDSD